MDDEFRQLRTYWRYCGFAFVVWLIIDLQPTLHLHYPMALAVTNTLILMLLLPPVLDMAARFALAAKKHGVVNVYITPAVFLGELMNLIPGNPFALGLPYFLVLKLLALLKMERAKEAEKVARRLIQLQETALDTCPASKATALVLLGSALAQQGEFAKSTEVRKKAIALMEAQPGRRPTQVAASLGDLCTSLAKLGQTQQALEIGNRALAIMESCDCSDRNDVVLLGITWNNLALAYNYAGNSSKALELYQKSLDVKLQLFSENSKEAVIGYNNVGYALLELEQFEAASQAIERAKDTGIRLGLQTSQVWLNVLCNSGDVYRSLGRLDAAEQEQLEALRLREKRKDEGLHESYHCLGKLYRDKESFSKAESYFRKALELRRKRFGADHSKVRKTRTEYAKLLRAMDRNQEAEQQEAQASRVPDS